MKQGLNAFLTIHVMLSLGSMALMDADLRAPLATIRDGVIDGYEFIGFGSIFIGIALVTVVLLGLRIWGWKFVAELT